MRHVAYFRIANIFKRLGILYNSWVRGQNPVHICIYIHHFSVERRTKRCSRCIAPPASKSGYIAFLIMSLKSSHNYNIITLQFFKDSYRMDIQNSCISIMAICDKTCLGPC
ncbi:hypothetical protein D3C78_1524590 [compost metagenome]